MVLLHQDDDDVFDLAKPPSAWAEPEPIAQQASKSVDHKMGFSRIASYLFFPRCSTPVLSPAETAV
jgi:hypothetical protein